MFEHQFHSKEISQKAFLVTGGAGFIGSNIVHYLLKYGAGKVRVLDNLSTGFYKNIQPFEKYPNFEFIKGDICQLEDCHTACKDIDMITHQAALGSVPRSIAHPLQTIQANVNGWVHILEAARQVGIKRVVYASSSSVYGDSPILPKKEDHLGKLLSPYAASKKTDETMAQAFAAVYEMEIIGLRYFNVFGPNQSPSGPYAAVIPLFIHALMTNQAAIIHGDGLQTRDFTYVENAVQANILALLTDHEAACNEVFNVAVGGRYSVLEVYQAIADILNSDVKPQFNPPRKGDIRDSWADIQKAVSLLKYDPKVDFPAGLRHTIAFFTSIKS